MGQANRRPNRVPLDSTDEGNIGTVVVAMDLEAACNATEVLEDTARLAMAT